MEGENLRRSLGNIEILGMNGWLVVTGTFGTMEFYDFPYIYIYNNNIYIYIIYWEFHHPN